MAIAFDSFSSGGGIGAGPKNWSHTCSGLRRILIVTVMTQDLGDTISGVTYNGVAMTSVSNGSRSALFYLVNPSTGTNTVSVSYSNLSGNGVSCCAASYTGVGTVGASNASSPVGTPQTLAVTTTSDLSWLVGMTGVYDDETAFTAGSGTTVRGSSLAGGNQLVTYHDSNGAKTPTGSYSLQTTGTILGTGARMIVAEITLGPVDYSVVLAGTSFTFTGYTLNFFKAFYLALAKGTFTLSGNATTLLLKTSAKFINQVKNSITPTNDTKTASSSFINQTKTTINPINQPKP